jgi:hypothetical protein
MGDYITDKIINSKSLVVGGATLTMIDVRSLTDDQYSQYNNIVKAALATTPSSLYCGAAHNVALKQAIDDAGGFMTPEDQTAFLVTYEAAASTRMTEAQVIGNGMMKFAVFNASGVMIGAITIMRAIIQSMIVREAQVRITASFFRNGVSVFNAARTALTANFTSDQATFYRFLLTNVFDVADSDLTIKVVVVDPHAINSRYEGLAATINYDADLKTLMQAFPDVKIIPALEGVRPYSIYGRP